MGEFSNKLIAILNEKLEVGVALNALAHMVVGLGASVEKKEDLRLSRFCLFRMEDCIMILFAQ